MSHTPVRPGKSERDAVSIYVSLRGMSCQGQEAASFGQSLVLVLSAKPWMTARHLRSSRRSSMRSLRSAAVSGDRAAPGALGFFTHAHASAVLRISLLQLRHVFVARCSSIDSCGT